MPWIDMINENEAEGELADIYSQITEPWGGVDNIMKIHSLNIESLKAHMILYKDNLYGMGNLLGYLFCMVMFVSVFYGAALPSGMFVPMILIGAL